MKLMIASKNKHKIAEIKDILSDLKLEVQNALDFPEIPDVIEDRETIEGNAIKKAVEVAKRTGLLTMADDTGLFVEALQGEPGVYSARYAGENATYKDNCDKMLNEMKNEKNREAHFKT
ncbi:MAG: non-canonical purine NTP pyrophosphatase, partial [Candidatus Cloacimonetes bacterium]|nr:non-canonical purine NTP pyrophosphatase [Candidatus Cloacimonadota bacterium]